MNPLLSLCMIVKNEEAVLQRCLESVKGLADEIIIVDTGSTDTTKEIALAYTDQVFDFKWTNDFSAARNESIRHASGKWILVLDADEYVQPTDHDQLRRFLLNYPVNKPCGFTLKIINYMGNGHDETNFIESPGARLFCNYQSIRYESPIHEQLTSDYGTPAIASYPFVLFHTGYTEQVVTSKQKSTRNLSILESMSTKQKRNDPYFCFVLGNEYMNAKNQEQALALYRISLDKSKPKDAWYFHLLDRLIPLEINERPATAYRIIENAIRQSPGHTDFYCYKGMLLEKLGLWDNAVTVFKQCIDMANLAEQSGKPHWIIQPGFGKIVPNQSIAEIRRRQGNLTEAVQHWVKVLGLQPKNYTVLQQLMDHLLQVDAPEAVRHFVEKIYPTGHPLNLMLLYKLSINIGSAPLADHYREAIDAREIPIEFPDRLKHSLIAQSNYFACLQPPDELTPLPDHIAIAAAIVYRLVEYAAGAAKDPDAARLISNRALQHMSGNDIFEEQADSKEELIAELLYTLWTYGHSELYYNLLQTANIKSLNLLAHRLYRSSKIDQALDLYSILLDNQALDAIGYMHVGQWHYYTGNIDDGFAFTQASFRIEPTVSLIGRIRDNTIHPESYKQFYQMYIAHYKELKDCPLLTAELISK